MSDATTAGDLGEPAPSPDARRTFLVGCAAFAFYLAGLGCMFLGNHEPDDPRPITVAEQRLP